MRIANREYNYPVADLLKAIKANREKHVTMVEKARKAYRQAAIEYLEESVSLAQNGGEIRRHIDLLKPESHADEYYQIISMLDMMSDTIIKIDSNEFAMFVMDNWSWSSQFNQVLQSYTLGAK